MYAGLLSVNMTLFLCITTKSLSNILCEVWLGLDLLLNTSTDKIFEKNSSFDVN